MASESVSLALAPEGTHRADFGKEIAERERQFAGEQLLTEHGMRVAGPIDVDSLARGWRSSRSRSNNCHQDSAGSSRASFGIA